MIHDLTPISELCFSMTDDVPRVAMRYAGCDLLVVDDAGEPWHLQVDKRDCQLIMGNPWLDGGAIQAILRGAKGFVAIRA